MANLVENQKESFNLAVRCRAIVCGNLIPRSLRLCDSKSCVDALKVLLSLTFIGSFITINALADLRLISGSPLMALPA